MLGHADARERLPGPAQFRDNVQGLGVGPDENVELVSPRFIALSAQRGPAMSKATSRLTRAVRAE